MIPSAAELCVVGISFALLAICIIPLVRHPGARASIVVTLGWVTASYGGSCSVLECAIGVTASLLALSMASLFVAGRKP